MKKSEEYLGHVTAFTTRQELYEIGRQMQRESIDETVKACADKCIANTLNDDEPVAFKSSILSVAEQLNSQL